MRGIVFILGFLLAAPCSLRSQTWLVQGSIENAVEGQVLLASCYGDHFTVIDSLDTSSGFFYFLLPEESPPGIYRIIFSDQEGGVRNMNRFVEFIFNRENIQMVVVAAGSGPFPFFENSTENRVYNEFMEFELDYEAELMLLYGKLYSHSGKQDSGAVERYNAMQRERADYMDSIAALYPDLYAVRIMNAFRAPFIPGELSHPERIDTLKDCFFDRAAIDDPLLLYAPVYTFKLIDYLSLFMVDSLSKEQQEEAFIEAADRIMVNVSQDAELRSFVVEFLLEGFELLEMEQVQMHLAEYYLDENCESDLVELVLSRMEGYEKMSPGQIAPDFVIRDVEGRNYQLSELGHDYVLVVFWSSTCEACRKLLPDLKEWYVSENTYDLEVVALSIDTTAANFEYLYRQLDPPWITSHDPLGWYGKVSSDYHVYATPTLYLLNREGIILSRPSTFRQFQRALKKLD